MVSEPIDFLLLLTSQSYEILFSLTEHFAPYHVLFNIYRRKQMNSAWMNIDLKFDSKQTLHLVFQEYYYMLKD